MIEFSTAFSQMPLIAILRGLEVVNAISVSDVLVQSGFRVIEVPLNSPNALKSIATISKRHGLEAIIGGGTVLSVDQVHEIAEVGGRLIVSPNMNPKVGQAALERGLYWCPGIVTPSEAFAALEMGASALKVFPAEMIPPKAIVAMRAVLPFDAKIAAVGSITPDTIPPYLEAGVNGFGLGSALFKPSYNSAEIAYRAKTFIEALESSE